MLYKSVANYITTLERSFQISYGRGQSETREAFSFSQKFPIMESPAVSESMAHKPLCVQEEMNLLELCWRKQQDWQVKNLLIESPSGLTALCSFGLLMGRPPS